MEAIKSTPSSALLTSEPDQAEGVAVPKGARARQPVQRVLGLLEAIAQVFRPNGGRSSSRADSLSQHSDHILEDIGLRRDEVEPIRSVRSTHLRSWL